MGEKLSSLFKVGVALVLTIFMFPFLFVAFGGYSFYTILYFLIAYVVVITAMVYEMKKILGK
jgi:nitrate reductase NapE component